MITGLTSLTILPIPTVYRSRAEYYQECQNEDKKIDQTRRGQTKPKHQNIDNGCSRQEAHGEKNPSFQAHFGKEIERGRILRGIAHTMAKHN